MRLEWQAPPTGSGLTAKMHSRELFDTNPRPMWVVDRETGRFLAVNDAAVAHYGYARAEFLDMAPSDLHADGVPHNADGRGRACWHRCRDGTTIEVGVSSLSLTLEGRPVELVVIDAAGEAAASDAAPTSDRERRQRAALTGLTRPRLLQGSDESAAIREIVAVTASALDVERVGVWRFNAERTAIVCQGLFERSKQSHSAGQVVPAEACPSYFHALAESEVIAADDAWTDARTRELRESYLEPLGITSMLDTPLLVDGRVEGVLCVEHVGAPRRWTDDERSFAVSIANLVSLMIVQRARLQSEARLRAIVESEPECVKTVSVDGRLLDMNPAGLRMIEVEDSADVIGRPVSELIHPEDRAAYIRLHRRASRGGTGRLEFRIIGRRGTQRWMETNSTPLRDETGTIKAVLSVTRDITERRRAEQVRAWETEVLGLVSSGASMDAVLEGIALGYEAVSPGSLAAILLLDASRTTLRLGSAPHLPEPLVRALDGLRVGPASAASGTAIHRGSPVFSADIASDPLWTDFCSLALDHGLRACWSTPVPDSSGRPLGTFAIYRREPGEPNEEELDRIATTTHLLGIAIESEQKAQALVENRRQLMTLLSNLPGMAYRCWNEPDWPIELASEGARALTGYSPADLIGPDAIPYASLIDPADRDQVWEEVQAAFREDRPFELVYRIQTAEGAQKWVWERGRIVDRHDDGRAVIEGFISDITELKETESRLRVSEERFRLLARATNDAIWDWDLITSELWWNEGFETLFGFRRDEVGNTLDSWTCRIHRDDRDRVIAEVDGAIAGERDRWSSEYRFVRKDGSYANVLHRGYVVRDASGRGARVIGGMTDLSERKSLENQLLHSQKLESVGRLAGGVAHDFNNLLTVILASLDLDLSGVEESDPAFEGVQHIRHAALTAANLTRQLLAFSRRQVLHPQVIDLNIVLEHVLAMLRRTIGEDIEVRLMPGRDVGSVRADPGQIEQVIVNLVVNARDAMPNGGVLTLETRNVVLDEEAAERHPSARPGPYVALAVRDTGVGMDAETRERIFEPFFTTKGIGKGTGLGLATVYGIIRQSGGGIEFDTEVGTGTTFRIYLPRVEGNATAGTSRASDEDLRGTESILLIEDEPAIRHITTRILVSSGYTVFGAGSGPEALAMLDRTDRAFDLLLTDVVMPRMSGPEIARQVERRRPGTRVLYMSGYAAGDVSQFGADEDSARLLSKPFTAEELRRAIRDVLDEPAPPSAGPGGEA